MALVEDIAAYVLRQRGPMSAMKLQKLVYYVQAWAVALTGRPLFEDAIVAWAQGPVVYELFKLHRGRFILERDWPHGEPGNLLESERAFIEQVLERYGTMSAEELSSLTHSESPWRAARDSIDDGERGYSVITIRALREFYSTRSLGSQ